VVSSDANVQAGKKLCPSLTDDDRTSGYHFAAIGLHPEIMGIAIPTVSRGTAALIRCHSLPPHLSSHLYGNSLTRLGGLDLCNPEPGVTLSMAFRPTVVFPPVLFKHRD
jgi:hypothetical protein